MLGADVDQSVANDSAAGPHNSVFLLSNHRVEPGRVRFQSRCAAGRQAAVIGTGHDAGRAYDSRRSSRRRCPGASWRAVPVRWQHANRFRLQRACAVFVYPGRSSRAAHDRPVVVGLGSRRKRRTTRRRPFVLQHRGQNVTCRHVSWGAALRSCASVRTQCFGRVAELALLQGGIYPGRPAVLNASIGR